MNKRILCIDDEESIRLTFASFLEDEGYKVDTAASADEALEKLEAEHFDLIFLDILLGRHSGINVLRVIRKRKLQAPVIMVTGAPEVDTAADAVRLGAFDYISKPVRQETLLRLAKLALTHQELVVQKNRYQAHLEAIFRSIRDGLLTVDSDMRLVEINAAAKQMLGIAGESIGENFELLDGTDGQCARLVRQTLETGQPGEIYRCECPLSRGGIQVLTLNTAPLQTPTGRHDGVVLLLRDETRMVKLERDLQDRNQPGNMIGQCEEMQHLYRMIHSLASIDTTVLITGESGTGKELVAEALHNMGDRRKRPLVKFNCAALPESLLESELFGHVKGAFTGAVKDKIGRFQKADGGTIFLDEIGDISPATQVRLLRVLQDKIIEKVGDSTPIKVDVRIVTATNKDLLEKVSAGEFREDLYFRLNVMNLKLPPLRQRGSDLDLLVRHFIQQFNIRFGKQIRGVTDDVMALFKSYPWPGNVRQLEHALEHAFVLCQDSLITTAHLSSDLTSHGVTAPQGTAAGFRDDRQAILDALEKAGGNKTRAAQLLGMSRRTIYRKLEEYGI
ncbi:sigma-54 dependent transcriptional regulator [Geothermobacter hydrogeniphilus]|uniref:Sigma-54-dependent Fis family transcriptional regulator n=1 Tax=Geothermobacter hydrogeniphilus TaxID=1969733 RepID=A0A1X0YEY0_9BACT|nr:sigma-54 dependent transcriptional regulator [Geothermobacter hydrogeniphilus]ORJ63544.1 sigma-54-dependent Fis family transcriptional regulator [Geothermobacter hydrogeniphilus]